MPRLRCCRISCFFSQRNQFPGHQWELLLFERLGTFLSGIWSRSAGGRSRVPTKPATPWGAPSFSARCFISKLVDSRFVWSSGSWSILSRPAKYLWCSLSSAKSPEPSSVCRPFLGFLKVNKALEERSTHTASSLSTLEGPHPQLKSCGKSQGKGVSFLRLGAH